MDLWLSNMCIHYLFLENKNTEESGKQLATERGGSAELPDFCSVFVSSLALC